MIHLAKKLTLFACAIFFAGLTANAAIDWRPVDPKDLGLKTSVVEKEADAEALFWEVWLDDAKTDKTVFTHYIRVKIFTARGVESQSRVDLPYFGNNKIADIVGRTIKPDGSIVELKKDAVFERTLIKTGKAKIRSKSFVMPGVEPGAILEYRWREELAQSGNYMRLEFQREIPIQFVKYYVKPFVDPLFPYPMRFQMFHMPNIPLANEKDGFKSLSLSNVPAFHEEPYMPPESQVRPWALVYYSEPQDFRTVDDYWADYGKKLYEFDKTQLKVNDDVRRAATQAIGTATTPEEKLQRLFDFCRTKVTNPYLDPTFRSEDLKKVKTNESPADTLKRGLGTNRDIDFLFGTLALAAGFEVRLARMADRSDILFDPKMENTYFMTRYDIAVRVGSDWKFFDPANRYVPYGMLAWREEGQAALIPDPKQLTWAVTPLALPTKSVRKRTANLRLGADGTLEGDVEMAYTGHFAVDERELHDDLTASEQEQEVVDSLKERMSTAEVTAIALDGVKESSKPFTVHYHIRVPQYAQKTGTRLFFQPAFFQHGSPAVFASEKRTYGLYFQHPWSDEDDVAIELPAGFDLDNADAPTGLKVANVATYDISMGITQDHKTFQYRRRLAFGLDGNILFPLGAYKDLRNVFDAFHERDEHTITLKASSGGR